MVERDPIVGRILECAIAVHRELGPGLIESTYRGCLGFEMSARGLPFRQEVALPVRYRGHLIDCSYRMDFVVDEHVLVELKAVEKVAPLHYSQLRTYLRLTGLPRGCSSTSTHGA